MEEEKVKKGEKDGKKRLENIDVQLESIRKKIKSVEHKYQIEFPSKKETNVKVERKKYENEGEDINKFKHDKIQQNINCINIFHSTNQILNPNKHSIYYN